MEYRTHRGERLSEIGIGCYGLSGAYGKKDPDRFIAVLRKAHDLGVTFFDTADVYGPAEEILGRAVAPFRSQIWIATKVGGGVDGKPNCSAQHVRSSCEQSLERLGVETIELYQIHFDDPQIPVEETVEALEALKREGKIRRYGVGHLPRPRLEAYFATGDVFSTLTELSAVARGARERILPLCREHDVGVIGFSVTGRGLLTGAIGPRPSFEEGDIRQIDPLFQRERLASGLRVMKQLRNLGAKVGKSPVQVAIAWVLAQPGLLCALTGPSTVPHLEENLGGSGWAISPEDLMELEQFYQEEEKKLRQEQRQSIHGILSQELYPEQAFSDLIYVIEAAIQLELATEKELLPLFQRLWPLRGQKDGSTGEEMARIQASLRDKLERRLKGSTGEGK